MKRIWKDVSLHLECNSCWMDDLPLNVWHFVNKIWWKGSLKTSEREEFFVQRFFSVRSVWKILTSALQTRNTSVTASSLTFSDSDSLSLNQEAFLLRCRTRTEMLKQFLQWLFIFNCIWSHAKSPNKFPSLDPLKVLASPPPLHSSLLQVETLPYADAHTHKQIPVCTTNRCSLKCIIFFMTLLLNAPEQVFTPE